MVRNTDDFQRIEHARGGEGAMEKHVIMTEEELFHSVSLFAKIVLEPHASIGLHPHYGESEAYYLIKGKGVFLEDDRETAVREGDICMLEEGHSHGMVNTSDENMEFIALVYPVR